MPKYYPIFFLFSLNTLRRSQLHYSADQRNYAAALDIIQKKKKKRKSHK